MELGLLLERVFSLPEFTELNLEYLREYLNLPQFISLISDEVFLGKIDGTLRDLANAFKFKNKKMSINTMWRKNY